MSGPEVRITLGRSGQVVLKGAERSRGERPGRNGDNLFFSAKKRNRRDGVKWSPLNRVNGSRIDKKDLRLKLMRKRLSKKNQNVDERGTKDLSQNSLKTSQPPMGSRTYMMPHGPEANAMVGSSVRPPNQILEGYSRLSLPRNFDEIQRVPSIRSAGVHRGRYILGDEITEASRPTSSPHLMMKGTSQTGNPLTRVAPRSSNIQTIPLMREEPPTVGGFLHSLGLGKYIVNFQAEEVDMTILKQMDDKDLKEMGIPMGPRKKIILALLARMNRQA